MARIAEERETVIRFCDNDDVVHIWSASPTFIRLMHRLGVEPETVSTGQKNGDESYTWKVTRDFILVHRPRKMNYTPEQRAAIGQRLHSWRNRTLLQANDDPKTDDQG